MPEPRHNKGESKQDYNTPRDFIEAVLHRYGLSRFACDLAADDQNTVVPDCYFTEEVNALLHSWDFGGVNWCNPPFSHILPWVRKAYQEAGLGVHTLLLLPAGVGSSWFQDWVHQKARVTFLNGRLTFVGCPDPCPKDLMLVLFGPGIMPGYSIWTLRPEKRRKIKGA